MVHVFMSPHFRQGYLSASFSFSSLFLDFGYDLNLSLTARLFMAVSGKLEVIIKINQLPPIASKDKNSWVTFEVDCDGRIFVATIKPKSYKKLEEAQANFPMWVAAISGKLGQPTPKGFLLDEAIVQIFEKKPKEPKPVEVTA